MLPAQWRKEHLMIQNLKLLGIENELIPVAQKKNDASKKLTSNSSKLVPGMFNQPNERMLLSILYLLLLHIPSDQKEEIRYCWPFVTLLDKSTFKRKAQIILQELERQGDLPIGSSQVSRIAAGHGPRVIDLIWRLSTYIVKNKLKNDFEAYSYVKAPGDWYKSSLRGLKGSSEIIAATQNMIVFKTQTFKKKCAERIGIQEQWASFARTLTNQIQEFSHLQRSLEEVQTNSSASLQRSIITSLDEAERKASMLTIQQGWDAIKRFSETDQTKANHKIIETAMQYADSRPRLDGSFMQGENSMRKAGRKVDLLDVVRDSRIFIAGAQNHLQHINFERVVDIAEMTSQGTTIDDLRRYVACTQSVMKELQESVVNLRASNDLAKRETCVQLTTRRKTGMMNEFCPLTPRCESTPKKIGALSGKDQEEASLVDSLRKISMNELSEITANCVREAARKKCVEETSQDVPMENDEAVRSTFPDQLTGSVDIVARHLDYEI